eukprot:scaffold312377_cov19-Tisochrysis_lutea.AAC.1
MLMIVDITRASRIYIFAGQSISAQLRNQKFTQGNIISQPHRSQVLGSSGNTAQIYFKALPAPAPQALPAPEADTALKKMLEGTTSSTTSGALPAPQTHTALKICLKALPALLAACLAHPKESSQAYWLVGIGMPRCLTSVLTVGSIKRSGKEATQFWQHCQHFVQHEVADLHRLSLPDHVQTEREKAA